MARSRIKGLDRFKKDVTNLKTELKTTVHKTIKEYADKMVVDARANVPVDTGVARDSIGSQEVEQGRVIFYVDSPHGAIQEFGLGVYMEVPEELREEALKFKGYKNGDFDEFLSELEDWCRRKGIDPNAAYPIALSILNKGMRPQPFFYPAFQKFKTPLLQELDRRLQNKLKI